LHDGQAHGLLLIATLLLCRTSLGGGKTNAHSGSAHLIIFAMYVMLIFSQSA